ncbi:hypothetical protein LTR56_027077 [Elasticomyces elasticus]|nr:hypothetical protein LTR56_027077 [Elasticomyces elasticus]KAK4899341.1 hypothetical protein LTR49_027654 [Elasticomyces elasticus]
MASQKIVTTKSVDKNLQSNVTAAVTFWFIGFYYVCYIPPQSVHYTDLVHDQTWQRIPWRKAFIECPVKTSKRLQAISKGLHKSLTTEKWVTVLVPAMVVHLLEIRSGDENVRKIGWSRFDQCRKVLQRLQESYASADVALALLQLASARVFPMTRIKIQQGGVHSGNGMIDGKDMSGTDPGPYSIQAVQVSMHGANDSDEQSSRERHQPIETLAQAPTDATSVLTASNTGPRDYIDDVFDALVNFNAWPGLFTADDGAHACFDIGKTLQFPRIGA